MVFQNYLKVAQTLNRRLRVHKTNTVRTSGSYFHDLKPLELSTRNLHAGVPYEYLKFESEFRFSSKPTLRLRPTQSENMFFCLLGSDVNF